MLQVTLNSHKQFTVSHTESHTEIDRHSKMTKSEDYNDTLIHTPGHNTY